MRRSAWCSFVLVSMLGCTGPRPPTFVEIEGEEGPVREWAPEDTTGVIAELPYYRISRHMDACTPNLEASATLLPTDVVGLDAPEGASEATLQLQCADGRLLRSFVWQGERSASEEPCGGVPVSLGEWRPSFLIVTEDDIGTVAVQAAEEPTCAQLSLCAPVQQAGVIERSERIEVSVCQDPGRSELRPGAPAEEWSECLDALVEGIDGDRCTFEGGCVGERTVMVDWGVGPQPTQVELVVWCGSGIARFASAAGVSSYGR